MFAALNLVGLAIAECVIAFVTYGLDMKGTLVFNAASLAGTGLGTVFRYFSYKKWVFLAGAPGAAVAAGEAAVSGFVDVTETSEAGAVLAGPALADRRAARHRGRGLLRARVRTVVGAARHRGCAAALAAARAG